MAAMTSSSFPVVLMDGDEKVHLGAVTVHPSQGFQKLQAAIAHKMGGDVAPHQIAAFLVRPRRSLAFRRRVPIDDSTDLSEITREHGDSYILAVLRRPRRTRTRRGRRGRGAGGAGGGAAAVRDQKLQQPPEKIILRRGDAITNPALVYELMRAPAGMIGGSWGNYGAPWGNHLAPMWNLQWEGEMDWERKYMGETMGDEFHSGWDTWRHELEEVAETGAECGECEAAAAEGRVAGFHWCVKDEVVEVGTFVRSPVGPIERPSRDRVPAAA